MLLLAILLTSVRLSVEQRCEVENPCATLEEFNLFWVPDAEPGEECQRPLTSHTCQEEDHWLVASPARPHVLACRRRECEEYQLLVRGECKDSNDENICQTGEEFYEDRFGTVVCVCRDHAARGLDGKCHQLLTSAYCGGGENKVVMERNNKAVCTTNPCPAGKLPHFSNWPSSNNTMVESLADVACYDMEEGVASCTGTVVLSTSGTLSCASDAEDITEAAVFSARGRNCRRNRVWSEYFDKCVRTY